MEDGFQQIGFVGLGIMGAPLAAHLLEAGYDLYVHTRTRAKAETLCRGGAIWCDSPADVGRRCRLLLIMVTDAPEVEAVLFGPHGAAATLPSGVCVVDLSTIAPSATQDMAARLAQRGIAMLDAPVTGGQTGAQSATLTFMVGGDTQAFQRVRPVLARLGKNIVHVGPSGSGQTLKACNQILCAVNMIGVCEALTVARRAGLDLRLVLDTLSSGAGGSWAWSQLGRRIIDGDLQPAFMIRLMQKDLRIAQALAERLGATLPGTALAQQLFGTVAAEPQGGALGTQAMIRAYKKLAETAGPV